MKFQPKTEKEIAEDSLWPVGVYPFEIVDANDKISKSNNEMIELKLHVFNQEGETIILFDYLLESMAYKLRHCADVCGLLHKYESGELVAMDFIGKSGAAKIVIQKDKTGQYHDKNSVADYIVQKDKPVASNDDGIPAHITEMPDF